uniref:Exonuclease domain-containing protein n=1 Tax=Dendroctonus ponderosae TaxID=77166 RepID=J3JX86_DENPD|nr:unknown [Dendroctonus ponderosae]
MAGIKTFAFIDLETTGLPSMELNRTKITELTILAIQADHLELGCLPRVQNKFTLCFNPRKLVSSGSEEITGLSNSILEHLRPFSDGTVTALNEFLRHNPTPICLVAHNGNKFDYPILRTEINKSGQKLLDGVLCVDSLEAFRQLDVAASQPTAQPEPPVGPSELGNDVRKVADECEVRPGTGVKRALEQQKVNETTPHQSDKSLESGGLLDEKAKEPASEIVNKRPKMANSRKKLDFRVSYKLGDVYQRLTNKEPENAHQAENDVIMLALSAATLGERFVNWANEHSRMFVDIPMMVPGKRIGT